MPIDVYLSLGSNQGNRQELLDQCLEALATLGKVVRVSSYIETEAQGFVSEHLFLNAVVLLQTNLSAEALLHETQAIERLLGRLKKSINKQYSDRPIDIDLLFYGNETIFSEDLVIPHPEIENRLFVLEPLMELAPNLQHPRYEKSISELYADLLSASKV